MERDIMEVKCGLCNELVSKSLTVGYILKVAKIWRMKYGNGKHGRG